MWYLIQNLLPLFPFLGMLWSPCCCTNCQFFSDDFAVDDLATNYTSVSGSWAISGGNLHTTSSSAVLTGSTANPNSDANTKVSVTANIGTNGDAARIILNYQNSSNYWFAEVIAGSSPSLKIYQRSGGTNTQKAYCTSFTQAAASNFTFCASIEDSNLIRAYVNGTGTYSVSTGGSFSQTGYGLGTGTLAGTVTFDNLTVTTTSGTAPCVPCTTGGSCNPCTACSGAGIAPAFISFTIAGAADNSCGTCASGFNVAVLDVPYFGVVSSTCLYFLVDAISACSTTLNLDSLVIDSSASQIQAVFVWNDTSGVVEFTWSFSPSSTTDCTALVGKVLTFTTQTGPTTRCTFTGATLTITDATFA